MTLILEIVSTLGFRAGSLRTLAARRGVVTGLACFSTGYVIFGLVRNWVYASLQEIDGTLGTGVFGSVYQAGIAQIVVFLALAYVPILIGLGNAMAGDGLGFSVSREEYRSHMSALLPLWGALFLAAAPIQWVLPHFVNLIPGVLSISIGRLILSLALAVYSVWAIKELDYLPWAAALGVFVLSWVTLPLFYLLSSFVFALPFFLMIPLGYLGLLRARGYIAERGNERDFQAHLRSLTVNPRDGDARYQLGLICLSRMRFADAAEQFREAVKIDPGDPDYHYHLGRVDELQGDWPAALPSYEETYRLNPHYAHGDICREVGKAYLETGNPEKALEFLRFFLETRGSDPEGRYWLALALRRLGRAEESRAQLNTLLDQARSTPRFFRKKGREWIHRSRQLLRQ